MSSTFRVRPAGQADGILLGDMVVEAANWRAGGAQPRHAVLTGSHSRYVSGWMRPGDAGVVAADEHGVPIGAAWYRMLPRADPGFGWVGNGVPELIVGVRPIWRSHGVGRMLLQQLCERARADGYGRLSLSVEHDNFAAVLYRSEGFAVSETGYGRSTMVKRLR